MFLLVFFLFSAVSCKKTTVNKIEEDTKVYEIGKSVILTNKSELTIQDVLPSKDYKLQTSTEGVQSFPYVYLKKDKGYDRDKVMNFFEDWSPKAFDPKQYKEQ